MLALITAAIPPPYGFLARWAALALACAALAGWGYLKGSEHVTAQWDAANAAALAQSFHETARKQKVADNAQVQYSTRNTKTQQRLDHVPDTLPPSPAGAVALRLPDDFVRLWNDANAATADPTDSPAGDVHAAGDSGGQPAADGQHP